MFAPQTLTSRLWARLASAHGTHRIGLKWPVWAFLLFLVFALLFDAPVSQALRHWPAGERAFFAWFTGFGKSDWILIPALLGLLVGGFARVLPLRYSWRWASRGIAAVCAYVFAGVAIPGLVTVVIKRLVGRARPYVEDSTTLSFGPFDWVDYQMHSFPSGHATTAIAFAVVLYTLTNGRFHGLLIAFGVLVGLSRIVVGDHYLSDVIGGLIVGTIVAVLVRDYFATRRWGMRLEGTRVHYRMGSAFVPLWRRMARSYRAAK